MVQRIPKEERLVIGADLNSHLGEGTVVMRKLWAYTDWGKEMLQGGQLWTS